MPGNKTKGDAVGNYERAREHLVRRDIPHGESIV